VFENDNEIIAQSLNMWANYIETGKHIPNTNVKPKPNLSPSQIKLVSKLRELSKKSLNKDINLRENLNNV